MSTTRKGSNGKRGQRHQNSWTYKPGLYKKGKEKSSDGSTPQLTDLCPRCRGIIQWKIKYDKYKPLTAPRKCTVCEGKQVRKAYHIICSPCCSARGVCGKCGMPLSEQLAQEEVEEMDDCELTLTTSAVT